ncbi:MAG: S8/S53 family peptidase [Bacteroidota bacterium]
MRVYFFLCLLFTVTTTSWSQATIPAGALSLRTIVQLAPGAAVKTTFPFKQEVLSKRSNIYLLTYADPSHWLDHYNYLLDASEVRAIQFDYAVEWRNDPNDEFYDRQPNLERTGFPRVWNENTGGQTADGVPIVVAVLDGGFDTEHEDLAASLWRNPLEIPDDQLDNDGNGYVDDIHGWNFNNDSGNFAEDSHGTQVLGILSAEGNNDIGVSGTNWNSQAMVFGINLVSDIIAAYAYVAEQRRLWQNSNGERGALVVATNASFGLEGRYCSEFPVWANMYDELGELGILTAAGTANRSWDVDEFGDMPTSCPTDFLIGVANVGPDDRLWRSSAWGKESVDLAAPGQGSYSTRLNDNYGPFSNTSAAAPYVTGAIALLYSLPCERLQMLVRENPASAARLIKQAILQTTTEQVSLSNLLATSGTLDVWSAWQDLTETCRSSNVDHLSISRVYPNPTRNELQLEFVDPAVGPYTVKLFDVTGRPAAKFTLPENSAFPFVNTLSLTSLPRGYYLLQLANGREVVSRAIILQ